MRTMTDVQRARVTRRIKALQKYQTAAALIALWERPNDRGTCYRAASAILAARRALGVGVES